MCVCVCVCVCVCRCVCVFVCDKIVLNQYSNYDLYHSHWIYFKDFNRC